MPADNTAALTAAVVSGEFRFDGETGPFTFHDFLQFYGDLAEAESRWLKGIPANASEADGEEASKNDDDGEILMEMSEEMNAEMEKRLALKTRRAELRKKRELEEQVEEVPVTVVTTLPPVAAPEPEVDAMHEQPTPEVAAIQQAAAAAVAAIDEVEMVSQMETEMEKMIARKLKRAELRKKREAASLIDIEEDTSHLQLALRPADADLQLAVVEKKRKKNGSSSSSDDAEKKKKKMAKKMKKAMANQPIIPKPMGPGMLDVVSGGLGGPVPTGNKRVCHRYLLGDCQSAAALCQFDHPIDQAECAKWAKYFMTLQCKFGDACGNIKCLYDHPTGGPRLKQMTTAPGTQL